MKQRTAEIAKAILQTLDQMDRTLCTEVILHTSVKLLVNPPPLLAEFDQALKECDARKWVIGVRSTLVTSQVKWSISEQGQAALAEMQ